MDVGALKSRLSLLLALHYKPPRTSPIITPPPLKKTPPSLAKKKH